jgi:hypothetical protein
VFWMRCAAGDLPSGESNGQGGYECTKNSNCQYKGVLICFIKRESAFCFMLYKGQLVYRIQLYRRMERYRLGIPDFFDENLR